MAFAFPAARQHDIMVGCDPHATIVLPIPAVTITPHIVGAKVQWVADHGELSPNVFINGRQAANQFHDIKNLIPHIPFVPNILLLIIIPFSSSKIMLGSGTVLINGKPAGVSAMLMLNCGDPCSFPTGFLIPLPPVNVFVGITWLDILMAIVTTLVEMLISYIANLIGDAAGKYIAGKLLNRVSSRLTQMITTRLTARFQSAVVQRFSRIVSSRFVAMAEREVMERAALSVTREVVQQQSFLFTRQIATTTVDAFYQRSVRETAAVITENFGVAVSREMTATMLESTVQQTIRQTSSEAADAITGKIVETIIGQTLGDPLQGVLEDQAVNISSGGLAGD